MTSGSDRHSSSPTDLYAPPFYEMWEPHSLYSLADWQNGLAFREVHFTPTGLPVIKIAEIKGGITAQTQFTSAEYDSRFFVRPDDLLFSWSGQPETSIDAFWWRGPNGWLNQHVFLVRACQPAVSQQFMYYLLKYLKPCFIAIARNKQTTGLGHVTKKDLRDLVVRVPDQDTQKSIVSVLAPFDDKIELNRQTNKTLEEMASAIFKAWFIDFEPVKAKAAGAKSFPSMPQEVFDSLPSELVEDSRAPGGVIPKGWRVCRLGKLAEFVYGKPLKEEFRVKGSVKVFGANGQIGWHNQALVKGPGVVIGRKGNPGVVSWADRDFYPIDTTFYLRPIEGHSFIQFWFHILESLCLQKLSVDSGVPGLSREIAYGNEVILPPPPFQSAFNSVASTLYSAITVNDDECATLAELRDTLLPKLLSGEVRVSQAEKLVS